MSLFCEEKNLFLETCFPRDSKKIADLLLGKKYTTPIFYANPTQPNPTQHKSNNLKFYTKNTIQSCPAMLCPAMPCLVASKVEL
jgi:hypothetical protein